MFFYLFYVRSIYLNFLPYCHIPMYFPFSSLPANNSITPLTCLQPEIKFTSVIDRVVRYDFASNQGLPILIDSITYSSLSLGFPFSPRSVKGWPFLSR